MKTSNSEPSGSHSAAATIGSRSTNLAGSKGIHLSPSGGAATETLDAPAYEAVAAAGG